MIIFLTQESCLYFGFGLRDFHQNKRMLIGKTALLFTIKDAIRKKKKKRNVYTCAACSAMEYLKFCSPTILEAIKFLDFVSECIFVLINFHEIWICCIQE